LGEATAKHHCWGLREELNDPNRGTLKTLRTAYLYSLRPEFAYKHKEMNHSP